MAMSDFNEIIEVINIREIILEQMMRDGELFIKRIEQDAYRDLLENPFKETDKANIA